MLTRADIEKIIPHRDPFLFVDEISELEPGRRAVGRLRLTGEEFFFKGHFPGQPIMPGVLQMEALAQTGAVAVLTMPENAGKIGFLASMDSAKFKRVLVPGDELILETEIQRILAGVGMGEGRVFVDGKKVTWGRFTFAVK